MSADDIVAANLWPWPDPLFKRDRDGRIIFVNSAFLQLYGGRIEDWRGNILNGWPAPIAQGAHRFETRAGEPPAESVYDWVEMTMADGNAMAIARNVTALVAAPVPPANKEPMPAAQPPAFEAGSAHEPVMAPAFSQSPDPAPAAPEPAPVAQSAPEAPLQTQAPQPAAPSLDHMDEPAPENCELEETLSRSAEDYLAPQAQPHAMVQAVPPVQQQVQPAPPQIDLPAPPVQQAPQTAPAEQRGNDDRERMMARRALPIEDSTSVLGSNWRDQVIAKAVGADAPVDNAAVAAEPEPQVQEEPAEDTEALVGSGLNILLAEDNAINALLTRTLLEAEGARVETVEDGALAVTAVQKEQFDLIFMDMRMPNMDGLESTRKIRAMGGRYATMPIIALTANAFDDDRNACFDSGMNDFMTKPVSAEELSEMVRIWTKADRPGINEAAA